MTLLQPKTVAEQLQADIEEFLIAVKYTNVYNAVTYESLVRRATDLQGKGGQVVEGCLFRARLYSATGRFTDAEAMFRNAEINQGQVLARIRRCEHLANHGFASEVLKQSDLLFANRANSNFADIASMVMAAGGFKKIVEMLEKSQRSSEVLKMTETAKQFAGRGAETLTLLGVSDEQLASMLDLAGERLRTNKLYWEGSMPDIRVLSPQNGGPALMFNYRVAVSPQESARLTWELTEALVTRDLDIPGIHVGFVGTNAPIRLAA